MNLTLGDLQTLADVGIAAATEAGRMIAESRPETVEYKEGAESLATQVVTEIDRRSETIILDALAPTFERFDLGLLSEEQEDDGGRLIADYFWCIDPLDGTLPFIQGTPGYAVSIALVRRDGKPQIGVVYDPVESVLLHAIAGGGLFRSGERWQPDLSSTQGELSLFADQSFLTSDDHDDIVEAATAVALDLGLTGLRVDASAGAVMNACKALASAPGCYFKHPTATGGGSLWDFAAIACLFHEAGAVATDMAGEPLELNRAESTLMCHRGVVFATDAELAQRLRAIEL